MEAEQSGIARIETPRVLLIGLGKGAGVSTIVLGLLVSLKKRGLAISACKVGTALIEPTHHRRVTGRLSHTLDPWILSDEQVMDSFARASSGAEAVIIEGRFNEASRGEPPLKRESELSYILRAPAVLVLDARGYDENLRVLLDEMLQRHPTLMLAGVIGNFVKDEHHNRRLKSAVESIAELRYIGGIIAEPPDQFAGKASITLNRNTSLLTRNQLIRLGKLMDTSLNIDGLLDLAKEAGTLRVGEAAISGTNRRCRIAVADDQAFHLTVQDNMDLLRRAGGELTPFSPLIDQALPSNTAAIYLPSGYLHVYAADVTLNIAMLQAIRRFAEAGGIIYAEGSSLAYLCRRIVLSDGESMEMVGLVPATAISRHEASLFARAVYSEVHTVLPSPLSSERTRIRGFRDSRWQVRVEGKAEGALEVRERKSGAGEEHIWREGIMPMPNVLATGLQLHWGSAPEIAKHFVDLACDWINR